MLGDRGPDDDGTRPRKGREMNIQISPPDEAPDRDEAAAALDLLRRWARGASETEVNTLDPMIARLLPERSVSNYPPLSRTYPEDFVADAAYKATMPDPQNGPASLIRGAKQQI